MALLFKRHTNTYNPGEKTLVTGWTHPNVRGLNLAMFDVSHICSFTFSPFTSMVLIWKATPIGLVYVPGQGKRGGWERERESHCLQVLLNKNHHGPVAYTNKSQRWLTKPPQTYPHIQHQNPQRTRWKSSKYGNLTLNWLMILWEGTAKEQHCWLLWLIGKGWYGMEVQSQHLEQSSVKSNSIGLCK